jgi:F0F1-type ATP synthase assembly protein I
MNFNLDIISANAIVVVPIIIAIVQAIKMMPWVRDHYSPLISIVVGMLIGFLTDHGNDDLSSTVLSGVVYGLIASGLYSGVKTTMFAHIRMKEQREKNKC